MDIRSVIGRVAAGQDLGIEEMSTTIGLVMEGRCRDEEIALLLTGLRLKGEAPSEIAGAAMAMRRHMTPIATRRQDVIDTCGTGGSGTGAFNISTAAALVVAAAGVPVAKHGNRGITSRSGSADVLAALGVNIEADVSRVEACLDELGICFCFAPLLHRAMKHVAAVRKQLGVPTIFNLLGPLANPAGASFQLLGVARDQLRDTIAETLRLLGAKRALVVHGEDGLDEVTICAATRATEVTPDALRQRKWTPEDFGLPAARLEDLAATDPEHSAAIIRDVLRGQSGPRRDVVLANAAAALWTAGKADTPVAAVALAGEAIDRGAAADLLERLIERSNR